jgi:hypothetical protein
VIPHGLEEGFPGLLIGGMRKSVMAPVVGLIIPILPVCSEVVKKLGERVG